jgi:hypothetical protein
MERIFNEAEHEVAVIYDRYNYPEVYWCYDCQDNQCYEDTFNDEVSNYYLFYDDDD